MTALLELWNGLGCKGPSGPNHVIWKPPHLWLVSAGFWMHIWRGYRTSLIPDTNLSSIQDEFIKTNKHLLIFFLSVTGHPNSLFILPPLFLVGLEKPATIQRINQKRSFSNGHHQALKAQKYKIFTIYGNSVSKYLKCCWKPQSRTSLVAISYCNWYQPGSLWIH